MQNPSSEPDDVQYHAWQAQSQRQWEAKCTRCGACCGSIEGDPCEHLEVLAKGKYACAIYEIRFGLRKTRSGREFYCVPIRDILFKNWPGDACCGYKQSKV